jgi:hypothetical protein
MGLFLFLRAQRSHKRGAGLLYCSLVPSKGTPLFPCICFVEENEYSGAMGPLQSERRQEALQ